MEKYDPKGEPFLIQHDNGFTIILYEFEWKTRTESFYAYDLNADTALFPEYRISLSSFVNGVSNGHYFDPKVIYDPISDRFILVLLKDSSPDDSELIVCFSTTNNPLDDWNIYYLSIISYCKTYNSRLNIKLFFY